MGEDIFNLDWLIELLRVIYLYVTYGISTPTCWHDIYISVLVTSFGVGINRIAL